MSFPRREPRPRSGPRRRSGPPRGKPLSSEQAGSVARLVLKPGREHSLERRHPWVFSGAVAALQGEAAPGATVALQCADGSFLGWAAYNPHSQIRARIWSFDQGDFPDDKWLRSRIARAIERRKETIPPEAGNALRLVHAESDGLPGLIVDRYADTLELQLSTAGADCRRDAIVAALAELTGCARIFERSDADTRALEGLPERTGVLSGGAPPAEIEIREHGLRYQVDVVGGQKTGFYLDQRDNRARLRALAAGREALNCFSFTGAFSLACVAGAAQSVLSIDSSAAALELARRNASLNGMDAAKFEWLQADAFQALRSLRDQAREFDLIVLDPPKFAPTAAHAERAARAYKDINLLALKLLRPGGLLATFSCSGGIDTELFRKIVAGAALDAGIDASVIGRYGAGADHPVALAFPEGDYLKGLLIRRAP